MAHGLVEPMRWLTRGYLKSTLCGYWECCPEQGVPPWNSLHNHLKGAGRSGSQAGASPVPHHFDKVLREASSSWALLLPWCYQNCELGKLPSAGARQWRQLHPARGSTGERTPRRTQESRTGKFLPPSVSLWHPLLA